ncbi:MAG: DUF2214 domain-containing protein [Bacteroidetes bacterium]|nr:MAG: DUF2214 domain-containing protein [Bacteroidota bacterium]PTM13036.1 MAG: DUF2214 domain-containing protein [Bacteroidota bacterium]
MTAEILARYFHFIGVFTWVATLVAEWLLLKPTLSRVEIQRLARIDSVYGLSAIVVVGMGLALWLGVGKPAEFYSGNWIFQLKISLAVLVGLLSIYPTVFFLRHRKPHDDPSPIAIPPLVRRLVVLELVLMAIIPLLATLMAAGLGRF